MSISIIELLLLISAVVAMLARRLRLPYSVGLVLAGIVLSITPAVPNVQLSPQLIFNVFLPPLVFEAALYIRWRELRKELAVISSLATVGVVLSLLVIACGLHFIVNWDWSAALVFGALISATDPVSVIATFKEAKAHGRLRFLIEAESLFNDGTAAVLFVIVGVLVGAGQLHWWDSIGVFAKVFGGGIICGAAVGGIVLLLAGRTEDHLVEITLTTVGAYSSFLLAQYLSSSGVVASLTAGLILGNLGPLGFISAKGKEAVESFWEYAAFVANSFVFLLIGLSGAKENILHIWRVALTAVFLVLVGRAAAVYLTLLPFARSETAVSARDQHILLWGGLRGALALALALGLPNTTPQHQEIVTVTFAVVGFSIFAQGLTIRPILRRFSPENLR